METKNRESLYQLRSKLLNLKRNKIEEPENCTDDDIIKFFLLLIEYEDYLLESALYVLQGGLDFEEFLKKNELQALSNSFLKGQKLNLTSLLNHKEELDDLEKLIKNVIKVDLIRVIFDSVSPHTKFTGIYNASGHLEAESLRLFLNSLGFPVRIYQESAGVVYGLTVGPLGMAEIMVTEEDEEQAQEILLAMEEGLFIREEDEDFLEIESDEEDY